MHETVLQLTKSHLIAVTAGVSVLAFAGTMWAAVIPGTGGNDTLRGTARADSLYGKGGNDRLLGLAGNDLLVGGPGNDRLTGGPGSDRLSCGRGRDTANADAKDRVGSDCESVKGIPKPTPEPEPTPEPTAASGARAEDRRRRLQPLHRVRRQRQPDGHPGDGWAERVAPERRLDGHASGCRRRDARMRL